MSETTLTTVEQADLGKSTMPQSCLQARADSHRNGVEKVEITDHAPSVTSRGAVSICGLIRAGRVIGYAVWSCAARNFVAGSWRHPLSWAEAVECERGIPWAG